MQRFKIRKKDNIMVIKGRERGKTGKILRVIPSGAAVVVEKVNMVKRHTRPSTKNRQGGILEKEAAMSIANVMFICDKCKVPVRLGRKILDNGNKVRICKKCGEVVDK